MSYDARELTAKEAALNQRIIDEIVGPEVMEPMERIGWTHGAPPAAEVKTADNPPTTTQPNQKTEEVVKTDNPTSTPAGTEATTTSEDPIDWESFKDANGLYAGKYKTRQDLVKGMSNVVSMAKVAFSEADAAKRRVAELEKTVPTVQPVTPPVTPAPVREIPTGRLDDVLKRIVDEGGTLDEKSVTEFNQALAEHTKNVAREAAREAISERDTAVDAENDKWNKVSAYMQDKYPDSVNFTNELTLFIHSNPLIGAGVQTLISQGKELEATEHAWLEFAKAQQFANTTAVVKAAQDTETRLEAADTVRKEAIDLARRDAGVVTTAAGGIHEKVNQGISPDEIEAAAAEMRRTGDAPGSAGGAMWRRLTIAKDLDNDPLAKSIFG